MCSVLLELGTLFGSVGWLTLCSTFFLWAHSSTCSVQTNSMGLLFHCNYSCIKLTDKQGGGGLEDETSHGASVGGEMPCFASPRLTFLEEVGGCGGGAGVLVPGGKAAVAALRLGDVCGPVPNRFRLGLAVLLGRQQLWRGPSVPGVLRVRGGRRGAGVALGAQLGGPDRGGWLPDGGLLETRERGHRKEEKRGKKRSERRGEEGSRRQERRSRDEWRED